MLGRSLFVEENINIFNGANLISLRTLLANKLGEDYPSEGSFEFEILSSENLFISYPAAVVRYKGPNWHTLAHTTQRIYSKSSGDDTELLSSSFLAEEGNQTIPSETYFEPFFIIHNGPTDLIDDDMEIEIQSINQRKQLFKVPTMNWLRRETKIFWLKDLCDYRSVTRIKSVRSL